MSIWGKVFGAEKVIEAGIAAGDALFFTSEEKANWRLRLLKAYEPFRIAQRWLALIICGPLATVLLIGGIQILISGWLPPELGKAVHESSLAAIEAVGAELGTPAAVILTFYFGGGLLEGVVRESKKGA